MRDSFKGFVVITGFVEDFSGESFRSNYHDKAIGNRRLNLRNTRALSK